MDGLLQLLMLGLPVMVLSLIAGLGASVAVLVASTASTRQRIQRLGRVLRPASGKEQALVYTIYATEPEADRLRQEAERLEGANEIRWLRIGAA